MSDLEQRIERLSPQQRELLLRELRGQARLDDTSRLIPQRADPQRAPLSFAQQRLWFLDQLMGETAGYQNLGAMRIQGLLDVAALARSLDAIVERHEVLRTTYRQVDRQPQQIVSPSATWPLARVDLGHLSRDEREAEVHDRLRAEQLRPYNLAEGPLIRGTLLQLASEEHVLILGMHHIVADGWSNGILQRELAAYYKAFHVGQRVELPELPVQYADYAEWQQAQQGSGAFEQSLDYWRRRLADLPTTRLPTDWRATAGSGRSGAACTHWLSEQLKQEFLAFGRAEGATPYMTLLAAYKVLLFRYTGQTDLVVGTPIAGRTHREIEGLIGFFVNSLVMRTDLAGARSFREVLRRVRDTALGAYTHQELPFERLVEALRPERAIERNPLFQLAFAVQNPAPARPEVADLTVTLLEPELVTTRFDLELHVWDSAQGLRLVATYDPGLFQEATIQALLRSYEVLLHSIVADPGRQIEELNILPIGDRQALLVDRNATATDFPRDACLHELFQRQAALAPDAACVVDGDRALTYAQLDERAEAAARQLRCRGVGRESLVAVAMVPSLDLIIAMLAVLKAGGAYVPLEAGTPRARLAQIVEETRACAVLTHRPFSWRLNDLPNVLLLEDLAESRAQAAGHQTRSASADNLAYVMFTSGSTGHPKGIAVPHRAVVRLVRDTNYLPFSATEVFAQASNVAFDAASFEVWGALANGARLVITPKETLLSPVQLRQHIGRHGISVLFLTTALFNELAERAPDVLAPLRYVLFGGEAADPKSVRAVLREGKPRHLLHVYGPTECATFSTFWPVEELAQGAPSVPIGRPLANTRAFVLGERMQPLPQGAIGQLYIGGDGLARGNLNRPAATSAAFVPDPFSAAGGRRLYATGDLVRYRGDGALEFLGRRDRQVKLRGYRVELEEIEGVLQRHPAVARAVVDLRDGAQAEARLVAYLQAASSGLPTADALVRFASAQLPSAMVPHCFVEVHQWPLNEHGKVDRQALAGSAAQVVARGSAPRPAVPLDPVEAAVASVYREILDVPEVPRDVSFFDLGGHSLLATQLVSRLRDLFQVELPLGRVFTAPSVAEVSAEVMRMLRDDRAAPPSRIEPVPRSARMAASFAQRRLWFLHRFHDAGGAWHVPFMAQLRGDVDVGALRQSIDELIRRHEALRTTFAEENGEPVQVIADRADCPLRVFDLRALGKEHRDEAVRSRALAEQRDRFDLATGPLLRAFLLRLEDDCWIFGLTLHHIVCDGWSLGVLNRELGAVYSALRANSEAALPAPAVQYADWAAWQRQWLTGEALDRLLAYWQQKLAALPMVDLPVRRHRPTSPNLSGSTITLALPPQLTEGIRGLVRDEGVTLYMALLAVFDILLARYSGQTDIVVGTPIANRGRSEVEGLIGLFVNSLVIRADLSGNPTFRELLGRVRATTLAAYAHQDLPFERLVEALQPERHPNRHPLYQVVFTVQNAPLPPLELSGVEVRPLAFEVITSRYDLQIDVQERPDRHQLTAFFNQDLFDEATVRRMLRHYEALLEAVVADVEARVFELPMLTPDEREQLTVWSQPDRPAELQTLHARFEAQARQRPAAIAVECEGHRLSYAELDNLGNQVAHCLLRRCVRPESLVGICGERSSFTIAGILGILKSGGAYVPLDPHWPDERLKYILAETKSRVVVVERRWQQRFEGLLAGGDDCATLLTIDGAEVGRASTSAPACRASPQNLAYVMYTSGSTGRPKGVMVTHAGVDRLLSVTRRWFGFGDRDVWTLFHSLAFDFSVWEMWGALAHGGKLVVVPYLVSRSPADFLRLLVDHKVTVLNQTPTALGQLAAALGSRELPLRYLILGGEALAPSMLNGWIRGDQQSPLRVVNMYGITEATVHATYRALGVADIDGQGSPIGVPLPDMRALVLDEHFNAVPVGVPGDLYLGGPGLARGYLNDPRLTAEKFIPDSSGDPPGARLLRTGDRVRYQADGSLEFLGRRDNQVKIRGFRVELGEIASVLRESPLVRDATVVVHEHGADDKRLVAYVIAEVENAEVRAELQAEQARVVGQWKQIYDDLYADAEPPASPTCNIAGWTSSYTGESIGELAMREQVAQTVARIRALEPRHILEIGCGTGLLLFPLSPHCDTYTATDVSAAAIDELRRRLPQNAHALLAPADDLSGIGPARADTVVLNSVVQYFPDLQYLERVLGHAIEAMAAGGHIFIGDVRSLPLWKAFATSVELERATPDCTVAELHSRARRRMGREKELLVDPAFFVALSERMPQVQAVRIEPRQGRDDNELTRFRYDVTLRIGSPPEQTQVDTWQRWGDHRWSAGQVAEFLRSQRPGSFGLRQVANRRVQEAVWAAESLHGQDSAATVDLVAEHARRAAAAQGGVHPQDFWDLEKELPYKVEISWAAGGATGAYDVAFLAVDERCAGHKWTRFLDSRGVDATGARFSNFPMAENVSSRLAGRLRDHVDRRLPEHSLPVTYLLLDEWPLTVQGKVDRRALPEPEFSRSGAETAMAAPRSPLESSLVEIWRDVLRVPEVGVFDNFFDLGGHSLLATQVVARIRDAFQVDLPLRTLFESPSISDLALAIACLKAGQTEAERVDQILTRLERLVPPGKQPDDGRRRQQP